MLRCLEEERDGGGGKPQSLKILLLRHKEVNAFIPLASVILLYTLTLVCFLSGFFFLFQPAGSSGSAVATPPPLVRGPQSVPAGKPSLQVSGVGQAARFRAGSREEGAQYRKGQSHHVNGLEPGGIFFFNSRKTPL